MASALSPVSDANGEALIDEDMELGDWRRISGSAELGNPDWSGQGNGGAVLGPVGIRTVAQGASVKEGARAWKSLVDPTRTSGFYQSSRPQKSQIERWWISNDGSVKFSSLTEYYMSAWYERGPQFPATGIYRLLMQTKQMRDSDKLPMAINVDRSGRFQFHGQKVSGKAADNFVIKVNGTAINEPNGRYNLTSHWILSKTSGLIEIWLDGVLILSYALKTLMDDATGAYPGVGLYITGGPGDFNTTSIPIRDSAFYWIDSYRVSKKLVGPPPPVPDNRNGTMVINTTPTISMAGKKGGRSPEIVIITPLAEVMIAGPPSRSGEIDVVTEPLLSMIGQKDAESTDNFQGTLIETTIPTVSMQGQKGAGGELEIVTPPSVVMAGKEDEVGAGVISEVTVPTISTTGTKAGSGTMVITTPPIVSMIGFRAPAVPDNRNGTIEIITAPTVLMSGIGTDPGLPDGDDGPDPPEEPGTPDRFNILPEEYQTHRSRMEEDGF